MSRVGVGRVSALLCLTLATPAGAQTTGNGLYEPFPSAASSARAKRFVNGLRPRARGVSTGELQHGSFVTGALAPAPAGAASARAIGAGVPTGSIGWWLAPALLAICATPLLWTAAVRRSP
jgi:hypothetical protein